MSLNTGPDTVDDLAAQITEVAYTTLLQQGLRRPFVDVELELWRQIRSVVADHSPAPLLAEVA